MVLYEKARQLNFERNEELTMFEGLFQPLHLLVILGIAVLLLGPKKVPELGKGLGEGIRGFKSALQSHEDPVDSKPNE